MKVLQLISIIIPMAGMLNACTEVDLCYADHPHRSELDFRFHWDEKYTDVIPDSMGVIAVRPVNILRYEMRTTSNEKDNKGVMLSPLSEKQPSESPADFGTDRLWVRSGEYTFAAFGCDMGSLDNSMQIVNADGDPTTLGSSLSPLYFSYMHYPIDDPRVTDSYGSWREFNAYSDYISSKGTPVFFAKTEHINIPVEKDSVGIITVDFTPQPLTQSVAFVFHIEKSQDVVVDSLTAEISGVPSTIELTTGLIKAQKTHKMLFRPTYKPLATLADSAAVTSLTCSDTINVTGIVKAYNADMLTGPGILILATYVHVDEYDEAKGTTQRKAKVFYASINLYNTLKENKLLDWDEEKDGYLQTVQNAVIEVKNKLIIEKDKIINDGTTSTGLDTWVPGAQIEIPIF